jgi:hypothetical protein
VLGLIVALGITALALAVAVAVSTLAVTLLLAVPELLGKGIQAVLRPATPAVAVEVAQVAQELAAQEMVVPVALGYPTPSRGHLLDAAVAVAALVAALLVLAAAQVVVGQVLEVVVLLILAVAVAAPKMVHPQEVAVRVL